MRALSVSESRVRVTNAYSVVIGFTCMPVSVRRGVAVVPRRVCYFFLFEFVQSKPVIAS